MSKKKIRFTTEDYALLCSKHIGPELCASDFMRAANSADPLERPCCHGKKYCVGYQLSANSPPWPDIETAEIVDAGDDDDEAFVPREYYLPEAWQKIENNERLPKRRTACFFCKRFCARRKELWAWLLINERLPEDNEGGEGEEKEECY